jgi:ATP-dependent protease ClpP protease subunit|tara:strand:- start:183 stop:860 length:678 start_codon:yes stop_codon:yes gene_type:complete
MDIIELLKGSQQSQKDSFVGRPIGHVHEFYLSGEIESSENYVEWFDTIRHAGESDVVKIYINSPGGDLFTAIQFMRVLSETEATVVASVEGACMSAATMIFLCAEQFEVTPHSMFMFHNYSGGTFGKGGEMIDQLQHERKWSEGLLREVYEDFLSESEITSILDNRDIWLDGKEILARLTNKVTSAKSRWEASQIESVGGASTDPEEEVVPARRNVARKQRTTRK